MDTKNELIALFDHVWERFTTRMEGLTDDELHWQPTKDPDLSLAWRLQHITHFLSEDRNGPWIGLQATTLHFEPAKNAAEALQQLQQAYNIWHGQLATVDDTKLSQPIGKPAGAYGSANRYSFVLHILDEFIHHTAESALLRDLYKAQK